MPSREVIRTDGRHGEHVLGPGDTHLVRDLQAYLRQWGTAFAESMYKFSARTINSALSAEPQSSEQEERSEQNVVTSGMRRHPVIPLSAEMITGQADVKRNVDGNLREDEDDGPRLSYWLPVRAGRSEFCREPTAPSLQGHTTDPFNDE
jgi:hypothetical protein